MRRGGEPGLEGGVGYVGGGGVFGGGRRGGEVDGGVLAFEGREAGDCEDDFVLVSSALSFHHPNPEITGKTGMGGIRKRATHRPSTIQHLSPTPPPPPHNASYQNH